MDILVKHSTEHTITCQTCNQPALYREIQLTVPGLQTRMIGYSTHSESITEEQHHQAMGRLEAFHSKFFDLIAQIKEAMGTEGIKLKIGRIIDLELGSVIPTACEPRTMVQPEATVRAYGKSKHFIFEDVPIDEITLESLLALVTPACDYAALELQEQYTANQHPGDEA